MFFKVIKSNFNFKNFKPVLKVDKTKGITFYTLENVIPRLQHGNKLAFISIPTNSEVVHYNKKSKANRIMVEKVIDIKDWEMWEKEEFCLDAIEKSVYNFKFIKNQTEAICTKAIEKDAWSLMFVKIQTDALCLLAVKKNFLLLQIVKNKTDEVCKIAIKQNPFAKNFIRSY